VSSFFVLPRSPVHCRVVFESILFPRSFLNSDPFPSPQSLLPFRPGILLRDSTRFQCAREFDVVICLPCGILTPDFRSSSFPASTDPFLPSFFPLHTSAFAPETRRSTHFSSGLSQTFAPFAFRTCRPFSLHAALVRPDDFRRLRAPTFTLASITQVPRRNHPLISFDRTPVDRPKSPFPMLPPLFVCPLPSLYRLSTYCSMDPTAQESQPLNFIQGRDPLSNGTPAFPVPDIFGRVGSPLVPIPLTPLPAL